MTRITIKYTDPQAVLAALAEMGFDVNPAPSQAEAYFPRGNTPPEEDKDGTRYITGLLSADDLAKVRPHSSFEILWRSDETDEDGNTLPRPTYPKLDEDGNVYQQLCGWI